MANNDFKLWATGLNADVYSPIDYQNLAYRPVGVGTGKASSTAANTVWRQASIMSTMIAQFIVDRLNVDVTDDGTIATIEANFINAIKGLFVIPNTGVVPNTYGPMMTLTVEADGRITALQNANLPNTGVAPGQYIFPQLTVQSDGRITAINSQPQLRLAHGECRLTYISPTQIKLIPCGGNNILIAGAQYGIPAVGIIAANTGTFVNGVAGQNLAANTLYYVYVFNNGGTLALDFSTTGHATDTTANNIGVEIKSGNNSRTLVGMLYTTNTAQFNSSPTTVLSWFNRRSLSSKLSFTSYSFNNGTYTELNSVPRVFFLSWADEGIYALIGGTFANSTAASTTMVIQIENVASGTLSSVYDPSGGQSVIFHSSLSTNPGDLTEGLHFATVYGDVDGGTATIASAQYYVNVRG